MDEDRLRFERIMELLHNSIERVGSVEASLSDFGTGVPLSRAEIHTVQAIAENPGVNVTRLAKIQGVTKGAVSQVVKRLIRKGMIAKVKSGGSAREVRLDLTALGRKGHRKHMEFHERMYAAVKAWYGPRFEARLAAFESVMAELDGIMGEFEKRGMI